MIAGVFSMKGAEVAQPENVQEGMTYRVCYSTLPTPASGILLNYAVFKVDGKETLGGVEAYKVLQLNAFYDADLVVGHISTIGKKLYLRHEQEWRLICDFGLQPGETVEGYVSNNFGKRLFKCLSIQDNPRYGGWKTMTIAMLDPEKSDMDWEKAETTEWIIGVGVSQEVVYQSPVGMKGEHLMDLESLNWEGETIFNAPTAEVEMITAPSEGGEVYDLSGRRVLASPDALPAGIYILRTGAYARKITVR